MVHGGPDPKESNPSVKDPVCGMDVDPAKTAHHAESSGVTYHFCSAKCRTKFVADPAAFVKPAPPAPTAAVPAGRVYTCPMHPEIAATEPVQLPDLRDGAGAARRDREDDESRARRHDRRFWVSGGGDRPRWWSSRWPRCCRRCPSTASGPPPAGRAGACDAGRAWAAWPFFVRGGSRREPSPNMFTLIGMGVSVAYVQRGRRPLAPGVFPANVPGTTGASSRCTSRPRRSSSTLILLGQVLELRARSRPAPPSARCWRWRPKTAAGVRRRHREDIPLAVVAG
jgi:Cu+-exporting ATPase